MRKEYSMPEIVITSFETESIIMISGNDGSLSRNDFGTLTYTTSGTLE
jgi:hypothetical protein